MTATDITLDLEGKEHLDNMVATYQLHRSSEELRWLSALNVLPTNDQDPLGASPTMEAQIAARLMADMLRLHGVSR